MLGENATSTLARLAVSPLSRAISAVARWANVDVVGIERLPKGRALLVANHAFGWDIAFAMNAIERATGRAVFVLGEHLWWKVPVLRDLASACGNVDGTPENADRLLSGDELVLVLPGGLRESMKPRELRYRLLWGGRYGFVRAAIRNRAPLVPLAAIGADDVFDLVGNAFSRGRRFVPWLGLPLPRPSFGLPIPHRVHLRYVIGEPIETGFAESAAADDLAVRSVRWQVEGALHELIDVELARRAGIEL